MTAMVIAPHYYVLLSSSTISWRDQLLHFYTLYVCAVVLALTLSILTFSVDFLFCYSKRVAENFFNSINFSAFQVFNHVIQ